MRLGVFCSDVRVAGLLAEWQSQAEFVWVAGSDAGPTAKMPVQSVAVRSTWEELLTDSTLDAVLVGGTLDDDQLDEAARLASKLAKPLDNTDFTIGWRKDMAPVFVRRALQGLRSGG